MGMAYVCSQHLVILSLDLTNTHHVGVFQVPHSFKFYVSWHMGMAYVCSQHLVILSLDLTNTHHVGVFQVPIIASLVMET